MWRKISYNFGAVCGVLLLVSAATEAQDAQSQSLAERNRQHAQYKYPDNYDPMFSRIAPNTEVDPETGSYTMTAERLEQIREPLMYPFYDG
ncbi:unnamed protein product, partial [Notodromas monacha]